MFVARYLKLIASVIVAAVLMMAVVVPMVYNQSMETTTIENEGAGWARFAYNPSGDYSESFTTDGSNITIGTQTGTASDMIVYATDVFSIVHADNSFYLIAPGDNSADLGASAGVASASGVITVTDSNNNAAYSTDAATWAYVPDAAGSFGNFDTVGANLGTFPLAAAGSFAGALAYNNIASVGGVSLTMNSTITGNILESAYWEGSAVGAKMVKELKTIDDPDLQIKQNEILVKSVGTPTYTDGDWGFNLSSGKATIVSYSGTNGDIVVPSTVTANGNTYTVTKFGDGNFNTVFDPATITDSTLSFPDTLEEIQGYACQNCSGLNGVLTIPASVVSIGSQAFAGTSFEIVNNTSADLGQFAFSNCDSLTEINISNCSMAAQAFSKCDNLVNVNLTNISTIAGAAFSGCVILPSIVIPSTVSSLGNNMFSDCTALSSIVIAGSPTITGTPFNQNVEYLLNLGNTSITAGSYGLSDTVEIRDTVPLMGYMAPASFSEQTPREGVLYDVLALLPVMILVGVMMGVVALFLANRRA